MPKKKKDEDATTAQEQKLQAVLLADSFLHTFRPLSLDAPKVLSPLNNVTLLDYSMDFLMGAGVEEVFVVCVDDAVEEHVLGNTWSQSKSLQVTVLKDSSLTNAGDALRELDKRNWVQSDPFLLLFGDVVTNVNVQAAMEAHKERHAKDPSAIVEVGPSIHLRHCLANEICPISSGLIELHLVLSVRRAYWSRFSIAPNDRAVLRDDFVFLRFANCARSLSV